MSDASSALLRRAVALIRADLQWGYYKEHHQASFCPVCGGVEPLSPEERGAGHTAACRVAAFLRDAESLDIS